MRLPRFAAYLVIAELGWASPVAATYQFNCGNGGPSTTTQIKSVFAEARPATATSTPFAPTRFHDGTDIGNSCATGNQVLHAGPGMKFEDETDDLPLRLAVGAAYSFDDRAALTAELTDGPRGGGSTGGGGAEVQVLKGVFFRVGYASQSAVTGGSGFDAVSGLTFGFGLKEPRWSFDYAAAPMGELGSTQRFSAAIRF